MSVADTHIVQKVHLKFKVKSKANAYDLQSQMIALFHGEICKLLEKELDRWVPADQVIQIDRLQLDLGRFFPENVKTDLPQQFLSKLQEALGNIMLGETAEAVSDAQQQVTRSSRSEADLATFLGFLETGQFGWEADHQQLHPTDLLARLISQNPTALVAAIEPLLVVDEVAHRLSAQFPEAMRRQVLQLLARNRADQVLQTAQYLRDQLAFWAAELDGFPTGNARQSARVDTWVFQNIAAVVSPQSLPEIFRQMTAQWIAQRQLRTEAMLAKALATSPAVLLAKLGRLAGQANAWATIASAAKAALAVLADGTLPSDSENRWSQAADSASSPALQPKKKGSKHTKSRLESPTVDHVDDLEKNSISAGIDARLPATDGGRMSLAALRAQALPHAQAILAKILLAAFQNPDTVLRIDRLMPTALAATQNFPVALRQETLRLLGLVPIVARPSAKAEPVNPPLKEMAPDLERISPPKIDAANTTENKTVAERPTMITHDVPDLQAHKLPEISDASPENTWEMEAIVDEGKRNLPKNDVPNIELQVDAPPFQKPLTKNAMDPEIAEMASEQIPQALSPDAEHIEKKPQLDPDLQWPDTLGPLVEGLKNVVDAIEGQNEDLSGGNVDVHATILPPFDLEPGLLAADDEMASVPNFDRAQFLEQSAQENSGPNTSASEENGPAKNLKNQPPKVPPMSPSPKFPRRNSSWTLPTIGPASIYVENAGLVLLNPFLGSAFEALGWMVGNQFLSEEAQENAVLFTAYLACGEAEISETRLPLAKLLCGMELYQPVRAMVDLPQAALQEADTLLLAASGYWEKAGKLAPDQFRGAFLMREGRLQDLSGGWNLKVDRVTIDILLEFLPWSYGTIKLPWMSRILTVDW